MRRSVVASDNLQASAADGNGEAISGQRQPATIGLRESAPLGAVRTLAIIAIVLGVSGLLYWLSQRPALAAQTDLGYYLGVVGASLMLILFTYPIYKRVRAIRSLGSAKFWFRLHMICGLLGPAVIIVHSGLQLRSLNAAWAFWSMVVVAASGVAGRFLYRGLHRGMYGELETVQSLSSAVNRLSQHIDALLPNDGKVAQGIDDFAIRCKTLATRPALRAFPSLALPPRRWAVSRRVASALARTGVEPHKREQRQVALDRYLMAQQRYAQFALFQRLFSWWHVAHVPFVVTLVLATIAHIVAVHLY